MLLSISSLPYWPYAVFAVLLLAALLLGVLAGTLAQIRCRRYCKGRARALSVVGITSFCVAMPLVDWEVIFIHLASSLRGLRVVYATYIDIYYQATVRLLNPYLPLYESYAWLIMLVGSLAVCLAAELIVTGLMIGVAWLFQRTSNSKPAS